jgi:hypothetical protein
MNSRLSHSSLLGAASLCIAATAGCMNYAENDRRLVFRSDGRNIVQATPDSNDKFVYVKIGMKRLGRYANDPVRAAQEESQQVVETLRLCPFGYTLITLPGTRTGDYGFGWTIACK